jgi:hypothetical protein
LGPMPMPVPKRFGGTKVRVGFSRQAAG